MADLFTQNELAVLLNECMRRYIEDPTAYEAEFETIIEFLNDEEHDREPNYGRDLVAYLVSIRDEV